MQFLLNSSTLPLSFFSPSPIRFDLFFFGTNTIPFSVGFLRLGNRELQLLRAQTHRQKGLALDPLCQFCQLRGCFDPRPILRHRRNHRMGPGALLVHWSCSAAPGGIPYSLVWRFPLITKAHLPAPANSAMNNTVPLNGSWPPTPIRTDSPRVE
jgi:hypothetical protein